MRSVKYAFLTILIVVMGFIVIFASGCGSTPPSTTNFIPLPPPANGKYPLGLQFLSVNSNQLQSLTSPNIIVDYKETHKNVGGMATEKVTMLPGNIIGVMLEVQWGDWFSGRVTRTDYFSAKGEILGGQIRLEVPNGSILQLFKGEIRYAIDRSRLYLIYVKEDDKIILKEVRYDEVWGPNDQDRWAMGVSATWENPEQILPAQYSKWGFWETSTTPFVIVTEALEGARNSLSTIPADILIYDQDSAREIIGRQSGFNIYAKGNLVGQIDFEYSNLWGRQPNTNLIGDGALSRIDWKLSNGNYTMLALTPQASPVASTLYVFLDDPTKANEIINTPWPTLYQTLPNNKNVILAIHAIGDLGDIIATGKTSDGTSTTTKLGVGGGVNYTVIGNPTFEQVVLARKLLNLLGQGGIKALGMYFPYKTGSGSGLFYYVSTLQLVTADRNLVLNQWDLDVGLLDRVGYPELP